MYVTKHIDWLSCTISQSIDPRMAFPLLSWKRVGNGSHGYRSRFVDSVSGMVAECDHYDQEQGNHFNLSGSTLEALRRELSATDDGIVKHFNNLGGKASRIDLTMNIHEGHITPATMRDAFRKGTCKAKATVSRFIEGKNGDIEGDTLYIGSPASDRQFRCYNKAAETGIVDGKAWIRFELELRRVRAHGAFSAVGTNGVDSTVTGHIADFVAWRNVEFHRALSGPCVVPADIPRKDTNRQRWLLGQVASALAKEIQLEVKFRALFDRAVQAELDRLNSAQ